MVRAMPLPVRVAFQAISLVIAGTPLVVFLVFSLIGYSGTLIGDPCPPYC
jgi:hypothetical protein